MKAAGLHGPESSRGGVVGRLGPCPKSRALSIGSLGDPSKASSEGRETLVHDWRALNAQNILFLIEFTHP